MEGSTPSRVQDEVWSSFERGEIRVGLYGMGGVGKTSLAMHINNRILHQEDLFHHVLYVTVSRDTSVFKLQRDIAEAFGLDRLKYKDEAKRAGELSMTLTKRKKSLLILDDVWEDISMEKIGFQLDGEVCKLLITTRKKDVCWKMNCFPVKMNPLSGAESWDLFKKHLGNYEELSDGEQQTARLIASECAGLPLGIITMAGSMRGETSEHVWRDALRILRNPYISQHEMEYKVFGILRFSYDRLNEEMQRNCFLYCALYPEDHVINRDELIRQFIAVGLLDGSTKQEKTDKGHVLLNSLENASLLECVTDRLDRRCIKMHDLVRDMAIKLIGLKGMVKGQNNLKEVPVEPEWIDKNLGWVSLMYNCIGHIRDSPNCPNVSVLLLQNNPQRSMSNSFFVHMIGLKLLNLSFTGITVLPSSVSNLVNLKALFLFHCKSLLFIPSLAKLTNLSELDLHGCSMMKNLPDGMEKLTSLEFLNVADTGIQGVHSGIFCKLCNLESFSSNYSIAVPPKELFSLRHLEKLSGGRFPDVTQFNQCVRLGGFNRWKTYFVCAGSVCSAEDLARLSSFGNRVIYIGGYRSRIGTEVRFLVPNNVEALWFKNCSFNAGGLLDVVPSLSGSTQLKSCTLKGCEGIECIIPNGWSKPLDTIQELKLQRLHDFGGLIREEMMDSFTYSFAGLKKLEISACRKLKKLWLLNLDLPNLECLSIEDCRQMEQVFATAEGEIVRLPKLSSLHLTSLSRLMTIWDSNVLFPEFRTLVVSKCPKVKKLGLPSRSLPSLEEFELCECKRMEEIFAAEDDETGDDSDTIQMLNLKRVGLWNLTELRSICRKTIVCNSLQFLILVDSTGIKLENCPISVPRLSVNSNNSCPVLEAWDVPTDWWDSLHWNDPATKSILQQLRCLTVKQ